MINAIVVTGHRSNPYELEGSFTIQFNAQDFNAGAPAPAASARGLNLVVEPRAAGSPSLYFRLRRESDGMELEQQVACPRATRNHATLSGAFKSPAESTAFGRFSAWLLWDGSAGVLSASWIVPRAKDDSVLSNSPFAASVRAG
jgi:hypothetical protein